MIIQAVTWSVVGNNVQLFGVNQEGKTVYVNFPLKSTLTYSLGHIVSREDLAYLQKKHPEADVYISSYDTKTIIVNGADTYQEYDQHLDVSPDVNMAGDLAAFFYQHKIRPQSWIEVDVAEPLKSRISKQSIEFSTPNVRAAANITEYNNVYPLLFWDMETFYFTGERTDPRLPYDQIMMISAIVIKGLDRVEGHLFYRGTIDSKLLEQIVSKEEGKAAALGRKVPKLSLVKCMKEADLIKRFLEFWARLNPWYHITYNGDTFDLPYLTKRAKLLNIAVPPLGLIRRGSWPHRTLVNTALGIPENVLTLATPGTYSIDLLHYFRGWYPGVKNYTLETISQEYLNEGKAGMTYEQMVNIFSTGTPEEQTEVAWYAYKDVVLLYWLWTTMGIEEHMYTISQSTGLDIQNLLRTTMRKNLINSLYRVDPVLSTYDIENSSESNITKTRLPMYRDIYISTYGRWMCSFLRTVDVGNSEIYKSICLLPLDMITTLLNSEVISEESRAQVYEAYNRERSTNSIHLMDGRFVYSSLDLSKIDPQFKVVHKAELLLITSKNGRLYVAGNKVYREGKDKHVNMLFPYLQTVIDRFMLDRSKNGEAPIESFYSDLEEVPMNQLFLVKKVRPSTSYSSQTSLASTLAQLTEKAGFTIDPTDGKIVTYIFKKPDVAKSVPGGSTPMEFINYMNSLNLSSASTPTSSTSSTSSITFAAPWATVASTASTVASTAPTTSTVPWSVKHASSTCPTGTCPYARKKSNSSNSSNSSDSSNSSNSSESETDTYSSDSESYSSGTESLSEETSVSSSSSSSSSSDSEDLDQMPEIFSGKVGQKEVALVLGGSPAADLDYGTYRKVIRAELLDLQAIIDAGKPKSLSFNLPTSRTELLPPSMPGSIIDKMEHDIEESKNPYQFHTEADFPTVAPGTEWWMKTTTSTPIHSTPFSSTPIPSTPVAKKEQRVIQLPVSISTRMAEQQAYISARGTGLSARGTGLSARGTGLSARGTGLSSTSNPIQSPTSTIAPTTPVVSPSINWGSMINPVSPVPSVEIPKPSTRGTGLSSRGAGLSSRGAGLSSRGAGLSSRGAGLSSRGTGLPRTNPLSPQGMSPSPATPGIQSPSILSPATPKQIPSTRGTGLSTRGVGLSSRGIGIKSPTQSPTSTPTTNVPSANVSTSTSSSSRGTGTKFFLPSWMSSGSSGNKPK